MSNNRYHGIESYAVSFASYKAKVLIRTPHFNYDDFEDLQQELIMAYLHAASDFDSIKGDKRSFIKTVINNAAKNIIVLAETSKRWSRVKNISLHEQIGEEFEVADTLAAEAVDIDLQLDLDRGLQSMPVELRELFEQLKSKSLTEISSETGIPRTTLSSRLRKLRKYLGVILGKNIF